MSASEDDVSEIQLYATDRPAWLAIASTRYAKSIFDKSDDDIQHDWPRIPDDYKTAVWKQLDAAQRERIRKLRGTK